MPISDPRQRETVCNTMPYTEHISGPVVPVPYTYTGMTVVWACSGTDFRIRRFAYIRYNNGTGRWI